MLRKSLIALVAAAGIALLPGTASARGGFGGGWHGGGWGGGGWRGGGWGWRGPAFGALGVGVGLGIASAAWGPGWGWGGPGWGSPGWGGPGWAYASWEGGCTRWRQVWTGWGWRLVPVNVCW
jgi:hypothetical protein